MPRVDREARTKVLDLVRRLSETALGPHIVLGGSTGLYGVSDRLPAMTEDTDLLIDERWLAQNEEVALSALGALGFRHQPGTCTFVSEAGDSLDLVGYAEGDPIDRIGGGSTVPVMVFSDLGQILAGPRATVTIATGGRTLSPAAFVAIKLLTVRAEKGAKDKLQALLLLDERRGNPRFLSALAALLGRFPPDRLRDARADAQVAFLALSADALQTAPAGRGYTDHVEAAERGLSALFDALEPLLDTEGLR